MTHEELYSLYLEMSTDEQAKLIIKISKEMESEEAEHRFNSHISIEESVIVPLSTILKFV